MCSGSWYSTRKLAQLTFLTLFPVAKYLKEITQPSVKEFLWQYPTASGPSNQMITTH
jgi:hypothetical protein